MHVTCVTIVIKVPAQRNTCHARGLHAHAPGLSGGTIREFRPASPLIGLLGRHAAAAAWQVACTCGARLGLPTGDIACLPSIIHPLLASDGALGLPGRCRCMPLVGHAALASEGVPGLPGSCMQPISRAHRAFDVPGLPGSCMPHMPAGQLPAVPEALLARRRPSTDPCWAPSPAAVFSLVGHVGCKGKQSKPCRGSFSGAGGRPDAGGKSGCEAPAPSHSRIETANVSSQCVDVLEQSVRGSVAAEPAGVELFVAD